MTERITPEAVLASQRIEELRGEALIKDLESESLRRQREEFCRLLVKECSYTQREAEYSYDIRRVLMHIQSGFDLTLELRREDFLALLSIGKDMLYDEGRPKFLPFIIRRQRLARPDYVSKGPPQDNFLAISIHPYVHFSELLPERFVALDELCKPHVRVLGDDKEQRIDDVYRLLDFCATIHGFNTAYLETHPKIGVPEKGIEVIEHVSKKGLVAKEHVKEGVSVEEHMRQKRAEANHLVVWRGLPYEICSILLEADVFKNLPAQQRLHRIEEISRMCLHEYFNSSFFSPTIAESPPRITHAEALLQGLIGQYGDDPLMRGGLDRAFEYEKPRLEEAQRAYIQALYDGEVPSLTREQLMTKEDSIQERESPPEN